MSKKQKIETNAKVEDGTPTTLDQIFGYNELSRYGTLDEEVYAQELNEMNKTDLYQHARKVGVTLVESVERLRNNLMNEFRAYVAYLNKPSVPKSKPTKVSSKVAKILAEGR